MKTAISIPDNLFIAAEKTAKNMGIARSQLYVKALEEYINQHSKENITSKLNELYDKEQTDESELLKLNLQGLRKATENDSW